MSSKTTIEGQEGSMIGCFRIEKKTIVTSAQDQALIVGMTITSGVIITITITIKTVIIIMVTAVIITIIIITTAMATTITIGSGRIEGTLTIIEDTGMKTEETSQGIEV